MTDVDEQLKQAQLQREQLEIEELLARRQARETREARKRLPAAAWQAFTRPIGHIANGFRKHARYLLLALIAAGMASAAYGTYWLHQERQARMEETQRSAFVDEFVAQKCQQEKVFAECDDSFACMQLKSQVRSCVLGATVDALNKWAQQSRSASD